MTTENCFLKLKEMTYEEIKDLNFNTLEEKMEFLFNLILFHKQDKQENLVLTAYIVLGEILGIPYKVDFA